METSLTVAQQIEAAKEGKTQRYIIKKMAELGQPLTDVQFTNKKQNASFTGDELKALSRVLKTKIIQ